MKALTYLTLTILAFGVVIFTVPQAQTVAVKLLSYSECDRPTLYKLGTVDPKFGLSQTEVLSDIQDGTALWSKAYGKPLFGNDFAATLTINFVYDDRSALNAQIGQTQNQLNSESTTLKQQIQAYEANVATLKQKIADFNAQVAQINRSGGASPDVYSSLIARQQALTAEGVALNARARVLNQTTNDFNSLVQNQNQTIHQFNQALAQKPEEGLYDGSANTITVYFADNRQELIHTLAHEFGHALGMQHTDDPQSLMYTYTSSDLTVTPQDWEQLNYVCREQSILTHWYSYISKRNL